MYGMGNYIRWPMCGGPQAAAVTRQFVGLSGCGGKCGCGGRCQQGLGYFDSGWDVSGWGWMEWGTVLVIGYMLMSTFQTSKRGYKRAASTVKGYRRRSRAARRARLERELEAA